MRPREQSRGQDDLFRSRLDQIINMNHALVRLGGQIDWRLIGDKLGEVYTDDPGQPPLPTRLMAGMAILKHMHNLSDDEVLLLLGPRRCRATRMTGTRCRRASSRLSAFQA